MTLDDRVGFLRRQSFKKKKMLRVSTGGRDTVFVDPVQDRTVILDANRRAVYGSLQWPISSNTDRVYPMAINDTHDYIQAILKDGSTGLIYRDGRPFGKPFKGQMYHLLGHAILCQIDGEPYVALQMDDKSVAFMNITGKHIPAPETVQLVRDVGNFQGKRFLKVYLRGGNEDLLEAPDKLYLTERGVSRFHIAGIQTVNGEEYIQVRKQDSPIGDQELLDKDGNVFCEFEGQLENVLTLNGTEWYNVISFMGPHRITSTIDDKPFGWETYEKVLGSIDDKGGTSWVIAGELEGENVKRFSLVNQDGKELFGAKFSYTSRKMGGRGRSLRTLHGVGATNDELTLLYCKPKFKRDFTVVHVDADGKIKHRTRQYGSLKRAQEAVTLLK